MSKYDYFSFILICFAGCVLFLVGFYLVNLKCECPEPNYQFDNGQEAYVLP